MDQYYETVNYISSKIPASLLPRVGLVLGSGLQGLVDSFDTKREIISLDYKDIPHFAQSTVQGHAGKLVFGFMHNTPTVCMVGRKHVYEGHAIIKTVYPIRIMKLLGVQHLVITNASGGLNPEFNVGDFMVIQDHVSFAGMAGINPLIGPNLQDFGPRFPPVSAAYDFDLRVLAVKAAKSLGIDQRTLREGVYTYVTGPSFETRAEARFLRDGLGGDCVGMSTVPEVVTAVHAGIKVLALSLITNRVATSKGQKALDYVASGVRTVSDENQLANHEEVLETSKNRSAVFSSWVLEIIKSI